MRNFKILGINHIGLAPKNPQTSNAFLTSILGLQGLGDELVAEQMTMTRMIASCSLVSESAPRLEILENQDGMAGPIAKFLAAKGGGIHHLALTVDHIQNAISYLNEQKIRLIDKTPRKGAHNTLIAFIHPESTGGLLIELVQQC